MTDIWFISDTHFNHENILKFTYHESDRKIRPGFDNVDHMNEFMIDKWNSVVKPQDKVYHLGDVYFGNQEAAGKIVSRLNGHKRLILGNHDDGKSVVFQKYFDKVQLWRMFKEDGLLFTHVPVHPSTLGEDRFDKFTGMGKIKQRMVNVHGHIHQNPSPDGPYICVCVEQVNYTPVHIDQLKQWAQQKIN